MLVQKLILDADPGIDDAVALTMALFDPSFEVLALTAVGGCVLPDQATHNCQAILEFLDPPRWPRVGCATIPEAGPASLATHLHGADGLAGANLPSVEMVHRHTSERVMCDEVRKAPDQVKIVTLGPLTNLAKAMQREPTMISKVNQLILLGGCMKTPGNITPAAEFNIYCDPLAAQQVFRKPVSKILIPLDVTQQIVFSYDFLELLPSEESRAGRLLRKLVPFYFRSHRQLLGMEGIHLPGAVALVAALRPELFELEMVGADVELSGQLTTGMTIFDRRRIAEWRPNLHVATDVDVAAVTDCILRSLEQARQATAD